MRYRNYLVFFILICFIVVVNGEENSVKNQTTKDSLNVKNVVDSVIMDDSTEEVSDSLKVLLKEMQEQARIDSLNQIKLKIMESHYDSLHQQIDLFMQKRRDEVLWDNSHSLYWQIHGHFFGTESENKFITREGFTELSNLSPTYNSLQYFNRFYKNTQSTNFINLYKEYYTLPIPLVELIGGTGDYRLNSGYVTFRKNYLFNKYNLDFRMNFVKGNLWKSKEAMTNSSTNIVIPLKQSSIDIGLTTVSYEGPEIKLSPVFRLDRVVYEHNYSSLNAMYRSGFIDLGFKFSQEKYHKIVDKTLERKVAQLLIHKNYSTANWVYDCRYEFFLHKEDFYNQQLNALSSNINSLLYSEIRSQYEKYNFTLSSVITEPYQYILEGKFLYSINSNNTGFIFANSKKISDNDKILSNKFIPMNEDNIQVVFDYDFQLNERLFSGLGYQTRYDKFNFDVKGGLLDVEFSDNHELTLRGSYHKYGARMDVNGSYTYEFGLNRVKIDTKNRFRFALDNVQLLNNAITNNEIEFSRDMGHHNRVKFGVNYLFADQYLTRKNYSLEETTSSVYHEYTNAIDIYAGLQISNLFETTLYLKNVLNQQVIFEQKTMPIAVALLMSWNFLN